jgi:hypothetical protein
MRLIRSVSLPLIVLCLAAGCGSGRSSFATSPGAATTFDSSASDAKAVEIADHVFAAAGGTGGWDKAMELRWSEAIQKDGAVVASGEQAWDRWNGRHYGRLNLGKTAIVVMRKLYEDSGTAFLDTGRQQTKMPAADAEKALATAHERWQFDTAALCIQFLLKSPGTRLTYVGPLEEEGQPPRDEIKVTFDPNDKTRSGPTYHVVVDRSTHLIDRLEIVKPGEADTARIGYRLVNWVDVNGMKFPTRHENIGYKGEVVVFQDIRVSSDPDDSLYVPSVQ